MSWAKGSTITFARIEGWGRQKYANALFDHALARAMDKAAMGQIVVTGDADPEIFEDMNAGSDDPVGTTAATATPTANRVPITPRTTSVPNV